MFLPLLLLATLPSIHALSQRPFSSLSITLVDVLNNDSDYTSLLRLLQRTRLIPTLNRLNHSTFFAPTNDAIHKHSLGNPLWRIALDDSITAVPDNVQEQLRQQLFYHLLDESVVFQEQTSVLFYNTLLYPHKPLDNPTHEPPPFPPWLPEPGGTLGGKPQRLRLAAHDQDSVNVAVDAFGNGGAQVVKRRVEAGNSILYGIDAVLEPPPNLATVAAQHTTLSYFNKILTQPIIERLNVSSGLTLFLPVNEAWDAFHPIQRLYLESKFANDDLNKILDMHAVLEDGVVWSERFSPGIQVKTIQGQALNITETASGVKVGGAQLTQPDIYASNGVLHTVSSLLMPPNTFKLTPEKYLLALDCTKFVSLIHSVGLTALINETDTKYTILALRDDVISAFEDPELPQPGSDQLKRLLKYHFIPGKWSPDKLKSGGLLETMLTEPGLDNHRQVLPIEIHSDRKESKDKSISFGGASVIEDPIEVNDTVVYFVSRPLTPPVDVLETILPILDLSNFLAATLSMAKADKLRSTPNTTFLIPQNIAFTSIGTLVSTHLLSQSKEDLENVILHHVLDTVQYTESLRDGSQHTFATLEGTDVKIDRSINGSYTISPSGGWPKMNSELSFANLLTQTGVVHEISELMIPRSVKISIGKLVKAAKGSTMASLANKAGFDWVLNGTAPPSDSPWGIIDEPGWTLLCPPDEAFKGINLTELYNDKQFLHDLVAQHLIPMPSRSSYDETTPANNQPLVLDGSTYSSARSRDSVYGDLAFEQKAGTNEYIVGIKGARGSKDKSDWARIIGWGRCTTGGGIGGVIQIDRLLLPYRPSWWVEYGAPLSTGAFGIAAICGFFYGVRMVWRRDTTEATYEPVGGFGRDDDD